jgi:hypothetical protein
MEEQRAPTILAELEKATSKLHFLADCLQYSPSGICPIIRGFYNY